MELSLPMLLLWSQLGLAQDVTTAQPARNESSAGFVSVDSAKSNTASAQVQATTSASEPPPTQAPGDGVSRPASSQEGSPKFTNVTQVRTATERMPAPELTFRGQPRAPTHSAMFVLGYRQFAIADRLNRQQMWHIASIEISPLRRYVRLTLATEAGIEGGAAARAGDRADFMLMQKVGVGFQYPHHVTPLVEFQGGAGLARVELFERNDLAFLWSLGVDAGAQWAVTKRLYLHAVVGWIRPVFKFPERSVYYDRFTFKVGFGF